MVAIALVILVPLLAVALYALLGHPASLVTPTVQAGQPVTDAIGPARPCCRRGEGSFPARVSALFCTGTGPMAIKTRTAPIW